MAEQHYREYAAYYRQQPFGLWRDDFCFAYLLATLADMLGGKGQTPGDFMPFAEQDTLQDLGEALHEVFSGVWVVQVRV